MLEARISQPEVIQPMIEPAAGDSDAQADHVGEIRQAHPARLMDRAEDDLLVRAMQRPPGSDVRRGLETRWDSLLSRLDSCPTDGVHLTLDGSLEREGPFRYPAGLDHQTIRSPEAVSGQLSRGCRLRSGYAVPTTTAP